MKLKMFVWTLVVVLVVSMALIGAGCKGEEIAEEAAEEIAEEATEEAAGEAPELGTESATYWVEKAGITPSGELTIYSYKDEGVTEWLIAEKFMEAYPDVTVNWVSIPGADYAAKIAMECETNTAAFDCMWSYAAWTTQFAPFLADVTDRIPQELKDDILKGIISATASGDTWHGVPLFTGMYGLVYNKDILAAAGYDKAPETWDELFECAEACTIDEDGDGIPEIYGIGSGVSAGQFGLKAFFDVAMKSVGGAFWNYDADNPKAMFNTAEGIRALQIMKMHYRSDFSDPVMATGDETACRRAVASGLSAMGLHGFGAVEGVVTSDFPENDGKFAYALYPHDPGFDSWSIPGSMGFTIREGGNVDAALAYNLFYVSPEIQKFMTQDYGFVTSRATVAADSEYSDMYSYAEGALEQASYGGERYVEINASVMQDTFFPIFENYLAGNIDEQAALDKLEEAFYAAWEE
ncbi:MAG: extracellular solute-binding protein [Actinomycetia bacterium]|nr:extracellular solute-binding protein [Actinomycetes bacterium]